MNITVFDMDSIGRDVDVTPLTGLGACEIYPHTRQEQVAARIGNTEVAVINKIRMNREAIDAAPRLKLICVAATGFDNIDTAYCREKGIAVTNVPGYSTDSVALVTVSTVLSLMSHLREFSGFVRSGAYTASGVPNRLEPAFHDLSGKTWGVVGYGNIGKKVAEIARAFGCRVIFHKRTPSDDPAQRSIDELCAESDIITLHCPLNDGTRGMIGKAQLARMKPSAVLVNTARGAVCDEAAVAQAVLTGKLGGFGCDVYSAEPFGDDHPYRVLLDRDDVILTPHMAWASFEARTRVIREMGENIRAFTQGRLRNRVEL